jgi:repressor LexA
MRMTTRAQGEETRKRILEMIIAYIQEHSYAPSIEEIGEAVGLKSKSTVWHQLRRMQEEGTVKLGGYTPRAIAIPGYKFVKEEK